MEGLDHQGGYQDPSAFDNQEGYDDAPAYDSRQEYRATSSDGQTGYSDAASFDSQTGYSDATSFGSQTEYSDVSSSGSHTGADDTMEGYAYGETESSASQNTYGDGDETNGWYRSVEEPQKPKKEKSGFGGKVVKLIAMALVFGVIAGTAFAGTTRFFGAVTGNKDLPGQEDEKLSGADFNIAGGTETADPISDSPKDTKALAKEGAVTDVSDIVRNRRAGKRGLRFRYYHQSGRRESLYCHQ